MRLSNGNAFPQFDSARDARGLAIKLLDVPGEKLMKSPVHANEQDFVMFNHPVFFVRDVAEYRQNFNAQANGQKVGAFFPGLDPRSWEIPVCRPASPSRYRSRTPSTTCRSRTPASSGTNPSPPS
jgi:hypothetical protein